MKTKFYYSLITIFLTMPLLAQTTQVTGTISDSGGQPLPGVSVVIKGSSKGTTSDFDGKYTLKVSKGDVVEYSYVGFNKKQEKMTGKSVVNVTLQSGVSLDEVVVIGSRNKSRTATDSPVPVDVIDVKNLVSESPQTSLNQILNYVAPSFTSNTQTISDGTDHIDPASLRGLGPDQVLVLVNGKRRHKSSLVNINGTFGRGSTGTDLNAIPSAAIERIEILRDGASALYGSDAIAGVINIVMKKNTNKLEVSAGTGAYFSKESGGYKQSGTDGEVENLSLNYGMPIGKKGGFINFTGMFDFRNPTNRMVEYEGKIFQGYNAVERVASNDGYDLSQLLLPANMADVQKYAQGVDYFSAGLKNDINNAPDIDALRGLLSGDVTKDELAARGLERHDFNMRVGQSKLRSGKSFFNMEVPVGEEGTVLYSFGGLGYRRGNAAGYYRLPYQNRTYTPAYNNGFLPEINTNIIDKSLVVGLRGTLNGWDVDLSNSYGENSLSYEISNTSNATMQNATRFNFDAGGFSLSENISSLDVTRLFDNTMAGINVAFGAEYRLENYQIFAGEEGSYAKYDINGNVFDPTDPINTDPSTDGLAVRDFYGNVRPGGSQVFPGFKPSNEVNKYSSSIAGYTDVELNFTKQFLIDGAFRYESFSDFGQTANYKIASRYKVTDNFALRGAVSTGFRAPSLPQLYFNSTSTLFVDGIPNDVGLFSNDSRVAKILGIPKLKQETSTSASFGITGKVPSANVKVTVDGYYIKIKNRVVKTGSFSPGNDAELKRLFAAANASKAAFFANAIDTKTEGLDVVITQNSQIGKGSLRTDLSATFSKTEQVGDIHSSEQLKGHEDTYFDETSRIYLESAVPRTKLNLTFNYRLNKFSTMFRNVYFGSVDNPTNSSANEQEYSGKVVTDLTFSYKPSTNLKVTVGSNNILDVYPDKNIAANTSGGRFVYPRGAQQFGFMGRYVFARVSFSLDNN